MSLIQVTVVSTTPFYNIHGLPKRLTENIHSFFEFTLAREYSKRTVRAYAYDLVVFFRFYQGKKKTFPSFKEVSIQSIIDFIYHEKSRNAAPRSINHRVNTVELLYRFCFKSVIPGAEKYKAGPSGGSKRFLTMDSKLGIYPVYAKGGRTLKLKIPHQLIQTLEPDEVKLFLSTLKTQRDRAIVSLMLVCGLRSIEIINLKLDDVSLLNKSIKINGKGNKQRFVPLPDNIYKLIDSYIETERPIRRGFEKERALFLTLKGPNRGLAMCLEGLRALFRYKRAISGVHHANPHRFRHTCGRNMAKAGMSLSSLQKLFGHNDPRTTVHYINLVMKDVFEDHEKAHQKIEEIYGQGT
jgi:site-specific recombinase XerD